MTAPTPTYEQMRDLFRAHTAAAVKVIVDIMSGTGGKGDAVRLSAAKEILNRGWGKPEAEKKKARDREAPPDYRGKALTPIVAEEVAAAGRAPPPDEKTTAPTAPPPDDDPTGYRAKRALWSAPAAKS